MEIRDRKRVIFWVRLGLILGTIVFVVSWSVGRVTDKFQEKTDGMTISKQGPAAAQLGPGDLQILTTDGSVDVTLSGNKISAGLSTKMQEQMRAEMAKEVSKETSGLGAVIAGAVTSGVASMVGIHVSWDLANVKEVRFKDGPTLIDKDGDTHGLSEDSKTDKTSDKARFSTADAERFIAAVNKRKAELGIP